MIYFDYAATSPMVPSALDELLMASRDFFANTESPHQLGRNSQQYLTKTREFFLKHFAAEKHYQLLFTSSATEANNLFLRGQKWNPEHEVAYFVADHPSLVSAIEKGIEISQTKKLTLQELSSIKNVIGPSTQLLALTMAHPQTGHILDTEILRQIKKEWPNLCLFIDGVQAIGKGLVPLALFQEGIIDGLSFSAHKFGGPKGIAGLFIKKDRKIDPLFYGGDQEFGIRSSTVALPLIMSMKAAYQFSDKKCLEYKDEWPKIRQWFEQQLLKIPSIQLFSISNFQHSPFVVSCVVKGIPSDVILRHLEQKEIFASSTSACSSKIKGKNRSFLALDLPEEHHKNVLRFSWGTDREPEKLYKDLEILINELTLIVSKLSRLLER